MTTSHTNSLSLELVTLLVQCDVPLILHNQLSDLGVNSIGKLAFCVASDKELMGEVVGPCGIFVAHPAITFVHPDLKQDKVTILFCFWETQQIHPTSINRPEKARILSKRKTANGRKFLARASIREVRGKSRAMMMAEEKVMAAKSNNLNTILVALTTFPLPVLSSLVLTGIENCEPPTVEKSPQEPDQSYWGDSRNDMAPD